MRYVFGDYTFDTRQYELCHAGESVKLRLKVFQVLAYLITHRDRPVPKQELCEHLWPQQFVSDATLDSCIAEVRHAVGDSGRSQHIIQTRRGYGYRFVAVVEVYSQLPSEDDGPPAPPTPHAAAEEVPERTSTSTDPALAPEMLSGLPVQWVVPVSGTAATPCAVCQHMNSLEVLVCVVCGTRLAQACPRCERVVRLPATYCPACGHELVGPLRGDVHPFETLELQEAKALLQELGGHG
jgi:DNA-binding winged helix-turn-helix (wHTH) protein